MKRKAEGFLNHEPDAEERQQQALELSEAALENGLRQELAASVLVGVQLTRLRDQKLYLATGSGTFEGYCGRYLEMDRELVRSYLAIAQVIEILRTAELELPMSKAQALLLSRLPPSRVISFWRAVISHCQKYQMPLSDALVRRGVRFENAREKEMSSSESTAQKRSGTEVPLDCESP